MFGARGLQVVIAQILRVAQPIVRDVETILADMVAHMGYRQPILVIVRSALLIFIDEVAIMIDEGEIILAREMAESGKIPVLIILTPGDTEFQRPGTGRGRRQGACPPARRLVACQRETIPIGPVGLQSRDFDMDAMAKFRPCGRLPRRHDRLETIVAGDFPFYRQRHRRHTAMRLEWFGCQLGPDDKAVRRRIARRHPQRKGIARIPALRPHDSRRADQGRGGGNGEQLTAGEHGGDLQGCDDFMAVS